MPDPGAFTVDAATEVTIAGVGTGTFTDDILVTVNQSGLLAGFTDVTTDKFLLGNYNSAFATYDLQSSIGPTSGTAVANPVFFGTTGGQFLIISVSTPATFSATTSAIPEPTSFVMLAIGVSGFLGFVHRR